MKQAERLFEQEAFALAVKRAIPVKVHFAQTNGTCLTEEGPVRYHVGDAILTGIVGESWPVARDKFIARYVATSETNLGDDGIYTKKPIPVRAIQIRTPIVIEVNNGYLKGINGDWLVEYDFGEYGLVREDIFRQSYDLLKSPAL